MAVSLTSKILNRFKQQIEQLELKPSDGGCFELVIDGSLAYSKLATGEFPDEDEIIALIAERLKR